jgi:deoxyribodipyrimidine photo-lyase
MPSPIENNPAFPSGFSSILDRIDRIDPILYGKTRNYTDGAVTYLSPYISRGVISTKFVYNEVLKKGYDPLDIEKFIQELAWRDYWQQVWIAKKEDLNSDIKQEQKGISNHQISKAVRDGATGIELIDKAVKVLYETGYMHNHVRMYTASVACNVAGSH